MKGCVTKKSMWEMEYLEYAAGFNQYKEKYTGVKGYRQNTE